MRNVGGSINQATGYEQIERLRADVIGRGELVTAGNELAES